MNVTKIKVESYTKRGRDKESHETIISDTYKTTHKNFDGSILHVKVSAIEDTSLLARNKELEDALRGLVARCEESELLTATEPYFKAKGVLTKLKTPTDGK